MEPNDRAWYGAVCILAGWEGLNFFDYWAILTVLSLVTLLLLSGIPFVKLYVYPTYDSWKYKINPTYPSVAKVREEVMVMLQGLVFSTVCPALSLYALNRGWGKGYCGISEENGGWTWIILSAGWIWLVTDVYEFLYHYCGHVFPFMWKLHKKHHHFYNPTPLAVIADDPIDQFFRAAPLFIFPYLIPTNIDLIFNMFSLIFYVNGLVQHSGFEIPLLERLGVDGHSSIILTSYHHYIHHAKSVIGAPLYNGQFLQVWDTLLGSNDPKKAYPDYVCSCSKCCRARGERSETSWLQVEKPNYRVLLNPASWLSDISDKSK